MKTLTRALLFYLLMVFIIGSQPVEACPTCETANTLFYQSKTPVNPESISIYYVVGRENKEGLKTLYWLAQEIDKNLKDSHVIGYIPLFAYRKYIDVHVMGKEDCYTVFIQVNEKKIYRKTFSYEDDIDKVTYDILMKILADEI